MNLFASNSRRIIVVAGLNNESQDELTLIGQGCILLV